MKSQEFDIIFCHDIYLLDFALSLKRNQEKQKFSSMQENTIPNNFKIAFHLNF